jgi:glycosyltransferase involved in cell wall biosynthesis
MRLTVLCEYGTLQGGERSLLATMDQLADSGMQFTVVAPPAGRLGKELQRRGVAHVPLDLRDDSGRRLPRELVQARLLEAVSRTQPDLVHSNSLSMARFSGMLGRVLGMPATAHLRDILRLTGRAIRQLNQNDRLVAVSQATLDYHVWQGLDPMRVEVIYNGVDLSEFRPRLSTGALKRELGIADSSFLIATIGQICLRKGHDLLAAATCRLADLNPDVHVLIVGERHSVKQESLEFEQRIERDFADIGLSDRLHRCSYRDDVAWVLNEVDALVHPARQEPLGRVLLEAAASGIPIIATDVGGTREILTDGESGLLVPPKESEKLAAVIRRVAEDERLRRRLGGAARAAAVSRFDVAQQAAAVAQVWRRLA